MQVTYLKAQKNAVSYHSGQAGRGTRNNLMIDSRTSNEEPNQSKSNVQKVPTHNQSKSFAQRLLQNQAKS